MINCKQFKNIISFIQAFNSDQVCIDYFEKLRWDNTPICPHCNNTKFYKFKNTNTYKCSNSECYKKYNVLTKTPFENSKIGLQKWFMAIYLCNISKKGMSSIELSKELGTTQKTAWFMLHRIREMFSDDISIFSGTIEVDETYIGGKYKNKHFNKKIKGQQGRGGSEKIPVFGILERGGNVRSYKVGNIDRNTLQPIIYSKVSIESTIMSDEWKAYKKLNQFYNHLSVDHSKYQYVNKENNLIHTNGIENYWSLVKRNIIGIYHYVSRKHIQRYCYEFDYKYNHRKNDIFISFNMCLYQTPNKRLKYKVLVGYEGFK